MEGDVTELEGGFYLGSEGVAAMSAPPVKVDRVVPDGDRVELDGLELIAHLTPALRAAARLGYDRLRRGWQLRVLVFCSAASPPTASRHRCSIPASSRIIGRPSPGQDKRGSTSSGVRIRNSSTYDQRDRRGRESQNFFIDPAGWRAYVGAR